MRSRVASARLGHLATVGDDALPHLVPVCFALIGDTVYSAIDHKPKSGRTLRRIANLRATGHACLLVDEYDEDWSRLWWIRVDGHGRVVDDDAERSTALGALVRKYDQYANRSPEGPVLALDASRWSSWSASRT